MNKLSLKSPAKINLYLRLTGKRKDGFNNLITVFHRISLSDQLTFKKIKSGIRLKTTAKGVPRDKSNLIIKAYQLLKREGLKGGVEVQLDKRIPVKAGLGGASSNAAATLIGLNKLYQLGLGKYKLMELGAKLGSDVPFFISKDRLSLGIDRGEKLLKLEDFGAKFHFVLFVFKRGLSTKNVYQKHQYSRGAISLTKILHDVIMLSLFFQQRDVSEIAKISYNDLLKPAARLKPEIFSLIKKVKKMGFPMVQMTGSGATVFCMVPSKKVANDVCNHFSKEKKVSLLTACSY